ncbi:MAG: lipocalin family protein [Xanthomonadales bacterium]|nr:lipocalin family protein [Xanthomonadales bacterium]
MAAMADAREPLVLIDSIDLTRYQGRWYEIARLPNRFQDQCVGEVSAYYELLEDGRVQVTNRCRKPDGSWSEAQGIARRDSSDARAAALEVRFAPRWLSFLPFVWGEYRVMALDDDYRHALVGSDDRKYLWILAREPELPRAVFENLVEQARRQGFDMSDLQTTEQSS